MRRLFAPLSVLLFLALPFAEIAGFVIVGSEIGVLATLALIILSAVLGFALLRRQGLSLLQKIQSETQAGRAPQREMIHGTMMIFAGILLIIPGFITDTIGLLLFIPLIRDLLWKYVIRNRMMMATDFSTYRTGFTYPGYQNGPHHHKSDDDIIDLDPDDYSSTSATNKGDKPSPWLKDNRKD